MLLAVAGKYNTRPELLSVLEQLVHVRQARKGGFVQEDDPASRLLPERRIDVEAGQGVGVVKALLPEDSTAGGCGGGQVDTGDADVQQRPGEGEALPRARVRFAQDNPVGGRED